MGLLSASMDPQVGIAPEKQTVRMILQDFKVKTTSYGKNFAMIGAMFTVIECNIESVSIYSIILLRCNCWVTNINANMSLSFSGWVKRFTKVKHFHFWSSDSGRSRK